MSSSAAMHVQPPINSSSDHLHFNADCLNPSAARTRRPRLAKLRKHSASQQARSRGRTSATATASASASAVEDGSCAGFNPFCSDKVNTTVHDSGVQSGIGPHHVFMFGAARGDGESVRDSMGSGEGGIGNGADAHLVFSANPGVNNNNGNVSGVFVFGACRNHLNADKGESSVGEGDLGRDMGHNLSDEMGRMNIKDHEDAGINTNSKNSQASGGAGFVFGASDKDKDFRYGQQSCCAPSAFQNIDGQFAKAGGLDGVQNGASCSSTAFNSSATTPGASKESLADFRPPTWDPSCFKDNLFPKSTPKGPSGKEKGSKCMRRKMKPHFLKKKHAGTNHLSTENNLPKIPGSTGVHSPMDFSPYQEATANVQRDSVVGDSGVDFSSNSEKQKDDVFPFVHGVNDSKGNGFSFSASSTVEGAPPLKRQQKKKKKFKRRVGCNTFAISPRVNGMSVSSLQFSPYHTANLSSNSNVMDSSQLNDQFKEENVASSDTIPATCDMWRLRGNQAHKDGDLSKAEDFYTLGINSVPSSERSECWLKPLSLCYSNRAATRMALGRIRAALEDCMKASAMDPAFLKVQMRAANCHLLLGEVENAQQCFNKCMESNSAVCLDRRLMVEAAEGLQKAQEVVKCINNAAELLKERTSDAAVTALELVSKALSISLYSEKLLQMKAEALCLLQKYDAAIQLCEQSQHLAEKSFVLANNAEDSDSSLCDNDLSVKLWRWSMISNCYFHLGRLEASLSVLEKLQLVVSSTNKCAIDNIEDSLTLASKIQELLDRRREGNENFKLGKYTEAIASYTAALLCHIKSRPFMAICFCNRAAAHQAMGQIADAIADCSVAIALDGNYAKAISRRATLHEMVRDYEQATCDLKRLIAVLESQSNEKTKESRQAHQRLLSVEDQANKGTPLNVYLILGIKSADTTTDIKKAYHKAALRHHPDKAGQLLGRSDVRDEGRVWKEILEEVYKDADKLFKMIGEAYAVLSDPAKRSEYDLEEEIRNAAKLSNRGATSKRASDVYGCGRPFDGYKSQSNGSSSRRYGRDHWKHSYSRW